MSISFSLIAPRALAAVKPAERLVLALGQEPIAGLDPLKGWGHSHHPLVQARLLRYDQQFVLTAELAKAWQLSADRKRWRIALHPKLKFSDGSPLTATDVAFTFEQAKSQGSSYDLSMLAQVRVLDPLTLEFELHHADLHFQEALSHLGIVPAASYSAQYGQAPISSGPYQLKRWDKGQQLILEPNPYYQGQATDFKAKQLIFLFNDQQAILPLLAQQQVHLARIAPHHSQHLPQDYQLHVNQTVDNRGIVWPMATTPKVIRQAIDLALDRQLLVTHLLDGFAAPARSIADQLPWGLLAETAQEAEDKSKQQLAMDLLESQGWQLIDGVRQQVLDEPQIEPKQPRAEFTLLYPVNDPVREQLALAVAQMLKPLGIRLLPQAASWEYIAKQMHQTPVLMGFGSLSPSELYYTHHSDYIGRDYFNSGGYQHQAVDQALAQARQQPSIVDATPLWQQAQAQIAQDQPWTWLVNLQHLYAVSSCLHLPAGQIEPHEHGWVLVDSLPHWRWQC